MVNRKQRASMCGDAGVARIPTHTPSLALRIVLFSALIIRLFPLDKFGFVTH